MIVILSIKTAYEILYQKSRKNYPLKGMQKSKSLAKLYEELKNSQVKNLSISLNTKIIYYLL